MGNNKNETKEALIITEENIDKIPNDNVYNVNKEFEIGNKSKSISLYNYFQSIGGSANSPQLGLIELNKSGAKSTVFHGFGKEKLAAVYAIKSVIEKGIVINHSPNYKNKGYDRYIISGRGLIFGNDTCLSVVIKSYPNNQKLNNKFYLHEVLLFDEKKENRATHHDGYAVSEKPVSGSASINNIPQNIENSNQKTAQKSDEDFVQRQDRNLVAVHNLTADELEKSLNLGGLAMPSIAVVKDDFAHTEYGDVSVLFSRDTIDPEVNRENKDKRVIDFDKNKRGDLPVIAQTTSLGNITESSLNNNLSQFKKKVNEKRTGCDKTARFCE